jgi:ribulose-5-phosphate 4-epimerase/fuculose-1-phosphate aldolase
MGAVDEQLTGRIERQGGRDVWSPRLLRGIGPELSDRQKLACAFRILARDGFAENISGHITWQQAGDYRMLVNPWGLWWRELSASDICTVATDGQVLDGRWDVTPAIHIHTELHRRRPDARVVIHNHPYYVCLLAAVGRLPELVHQSGTAFVDDLRFVSEYDGEVDSPELGAALATQIGDASVVILANHGVIVTGPTLEEATFRGQGAGPPCRAGAARRRQRGRQPDLDLRRRRAADGRLQRGGRTARRRVADGARPLRRDAVWCL